MSLIDTLHGQHVYTRRVARLSSALAQALGPGDQTVLDVGCGDGLISRMIGELRPELRLQGIDVLVRPTVHVPVTAFDGRHIPFGGASFDTVLFVDVLHHTPDPTVLLREAFRVARRFVVIKDHNLDGLLAGPTLRFMDWVGNARHGVSLPYNFWPRARWRRALEDLGGTVELWQENLSIYPWFADWCFGRSLHFVTRVAVPSSPTAGERQRQDEAAK